MSQLVPFLNFGLDCNTDSVEDSDVMYSYDFIDKSKMVSFLNLQIHVFLDSKAIKAEHVDNSYTIIKLMSHC